VRGILVLVLAYRIVEEREQEDDVRLAAANRRREAEPGVREGAPVTLAVVE
jgi:hypothetical protein